jgi:hypothetical protein
MSKTRIETQRPAAKGKHQRQNRRWSVRENPPNGINWGSQIWPGAGAGTAIPFAQWVFDTGLAAAGILSGEVRLNNVQGSLVTHVFVSKTPASGTDPTAAWAVNDPLRIYYRDDTTMWVEYKITVVTSGASWWDYTVTYTANSGNFVTPPDATPVTLTERTSQPGTARTDPEGPAPFDPADMTIAEVQGEVDAWTATGQELIDMIQAVLDLERAGKNRSTLVNWLDAKLGAI